MIALLPAAGLSRRMGTQKLLLPFGAGTVLEAVIGNLRAAGLIADQIGRASCRERV